MVRVKCLEHVGVVVANGDGADAGEGVQHGVAIRVNNVVAKRLVVVRKERDRGHGLDLDQHKTTKWSGLVGITCGTSNCHSGNVSSCLIIKVKRC